MDGCIRITPTGKPKKRWPGGGNVRACVCVCGVDARLFSFVLTKKRVVRGGVDLLTPLTQAIDAQGRRKLLEQIAQGKCEARVACCHVHPDDMYWTKQCRLKLKRGIRHIQDSYDIFTFFRQRGIRAHSCV